MYIIKYVFFLCIKAKCVRLYYTMGIILYLYNIHMYDIYNLKKIEGTFFVFRFGQLTYHHKKAT